MSKFIESSFRYPRTDDHNSRSVDLANNGRVHLHLVLRAILLTAFAVVLILNLSQETFAQSRALEQLVEIFEKHGLISAPELRSIRDAMAEDYSRMRKWEEAIKDREKVLDEREEAIRKREKDLESKERGSTYNSIGDVPSTLLGKTQEVSVSSPKKEGGKPVLAESCNPDRSFQLQAFFDDGFWLRSRDQKSFSLSLGGLLQTDYRYFEYEKEDPSKNKFDLRRVRLALKGTVTPYWDYKFEYEFEGAGARNLLDAYVDMHLHPWVSFRVGQFKEPFGLEHTTKDNRLFTAERSMGYYLVPKRDLGLMAYSSVFQDRVYYGLGIFNGDGPDDATGGDVDAPQFCGRLTLSPFYLKGIPFLKYFMLGGSYTCSRIDRNNVDIHVRTTGLTQFFDVATRAKFNIIRNAENLTRFGMDLGWAVGPFALMAESIDVEYTGIQSGNDRFTIDLKDYYVSLLWMVTGENPQFSEGVFQPIRPRRNLGEGGWGGLGLAFRYDKFEAAKDVYDNLVFPGNSVREGKAITYALNWHLNPYAILIFDATITEFDIPLLVGRDAITGTAIYSGQEKVFTGRFQLRF